MKKAYFLSDLHLGASYFSSTHKRERRVVKFLEEISEDASEVYLLGDILDYWFEYRYVVPRGYVRFFGQLARMADAGIKITWIIGNHDIWIFDYIPSELGVRVIDGILDCEILGSRFVMAHGDGIWQDSRRFGIIRAIFRNRFCQKLYAAIHPRWTVPFAYAWSRHSRVGGEPKIQHREEDRLKRKEAGDSLPKNIKALQNFCIDYAGSHPESKYFLFGHLHQLLKEDLPNGRQMIVLGDWINLDSYAVFDGDTLSLHTYK